MFEPFLGGRFEKVSPITAVGNVYSFTGAQLTRAHRAPQSARRARRHRIRVDRRGTRVQGRDGAGEAPRRSGAELRDARSHVVVHSAHAERIDRVPDLRLRSDCASTRMRSPRRATRRRARASRTSAAMARCRCSSCSSWAATSSLFVESRYEIPIAALVLPKLGSPTLELRHLMGAAGVGSLPKLEQELSVGLRLSCPAIRGDVRRRRRSRLARLRLDRIGPVTSRGAHCLLTREGVC